MLRQWLTLVLLLAALSGMVGAMSSVFSSNTSIDGDAGPPTTLSDGGCDAGGGTCPVMSPGDRVPRSAGDPTVTTVKRSETTITFKTDKAPELDIYAGSGSLTDCDPQQDTVTFTINASDLRDARNTAGLASARLMLRVWDVDMYGIPSLPECQVEMDRVSFNGHTLGTLTGANDVYSTCSFPVQPEWIIDGPNTVRVDIDTLQTPCWCVLIDYAELTIDLEPRPAIAAINISPSVPVTAQVITFTATFDERPGYEITGIQWYLYNGSSQELIASSSNEGKKVNPWHFTPSVGRYGNHVIVCRALCRHTRTGAEGLACGERRLDFKVFFPMVWGSSGWETNEDKTPAWARDPTNPGIGAKKVPNWFRYWKQDRAIDGIEPFGWDPTAGAGWMKTDTGEAALGPQGASYWPAKMITTHFGPEQLAGYVGIDTATATVWHERRHDEIARAWDAGGPFEGMTDSDNSYPNDDSLPDDFENGTLGTPWEPTGSWTDWQKTDTYDFAHIYSSDYSTYGDNEYLAYRAENAARGSKKHDDRDWSATGVMAKAQGATGLTSRFVAGGSSAFTTGTRDSAGGTGFTGPFSDTGIDTNGNGLFDLVRVTAGLGVDETARYTVEGRFTDPAGNDLAFASAIGELDAGTYSVELDFDAIELQSAGAGGPYRLTVEVYAGGRDRFLRDRVENALSTRAYSLAELEGGQIALTGSYADAGIDTDGDGAFDYLRLDSGVSVAQAGTCTVMGSLYAGETLVATGSEAANLDSGPQTASLRFDGVTIALHQRDGPFRVRNLTIADADGRPLAFAADPHTTATYAWTAFGSASATLSGAYASRGVDTDGFPSLFEYLGVDVGLEVHRPGRYAIEGTLVDRKGQNVTRTSVSRTLGTGTQAVTLLFDGAAINRNNVNGVFVLTNLSVYDPEGRLVATGANVHTTASYNNDIFNDFVFLLGAHSDAGEDTDGDGLFDNLSIRFQVTAPAIAGYVTINGRLLAPDGTEVGWARAYENFYDMPKHTREVVLRFDGRRIYATKASGAFLLADLTTYMSDAYGHDLYPPPANVPGYFATAFSTNVYQYAQFERTGVIAGTVYSVWGGPVANADVYVNGIARDVTDAAGAYQLPMDAGGTYTIRVSPPAHVGLESASVTLAYTANTEVVQDFVLPAAGTAPGPNVTGIEPATGVSGTIVEVTVSGTGLVDDCTVMLNRTGGPVIPGLPLMYSATNTTALLDLAGAPDGAYSVVVTNPDGRQGMLADAFTVTGGTEPTATVTVTVTGTATVTETVTETATPTVTATETGTPAPWLEADFEANVTSGPAPLVVRFTDASRGSVPYRTWWSFGDGTTSTERSPVHVFSTPGAFSVWLLVRAGELSAYHRETITVTGVAVLPVPGGAMPPRDLDGDGRYEDVNGNGNQDFQDIILYFDQMAWIAANEPLSAFDYNVNGSIDFADVIWLFDHL